MTHSSVAVLSNMGVIKSIRDGGYQQAVQHGVTRNLVKGLMDLIPGLGSTDDAITDEVKSELRVGYASHWAESNPTRYFVAADGNWVECKTEAEMLSHKKADKFQLDVHVAFGYTQQAFGALKTEEPLKHALIKEVRDDFNKYCSNRINDLKGQAKKIYNEMHGIVRERAPTAQFIDWVLTGDKSQIATIRQRCINAKSKGDETADIAKLDKAIAAFKMALTK